MSEKKRNVQSLGRECERLQREIERLKVELDRCRRAEPKTSSSPKLLNADEKTFVGAVLRKARELAPPDTPSFLPAKVFISDAFGALVKAGDLGAADLRSFKERLVDAHKSGKLDLARCDLVEAYDPKTVAESETIHSVSGWGEGSTYHFISLPNRVR